MTLLGELAPQLDWSEPDGGLGIWVELPRGSAASFREVALRHGVAVVAGNSFSLDGSLDKFIRVSLGPERSVLTEGITRLGRAWAEYDDTRAVHESAGPTFVV
ncbi:MAG: hypothetical protein WAS54_05285 [Scrofimicrobium sp.]